MIKSYWIFGSLSDSLQALPAWPTVGQSLCCIYTGVIKPGSQPDWVSYLQGCSLSPGSKSCLSEIWAKSDKIIQFKQTQSSNHVKPNQRKNTIQQRQQKSCLKSFFSSSNRAIEFCGERVTKPKREKGLWFLSSCLDSVLMAQTVCVLTES